MSESQGELGHLIEDMSRSIAEVTTAVVAVRSGSYVGAVTAGMAAVHDVSQTISEATPIIVQVKDDVQIVVREVSAIFQSETIHAIEVEVIHITHGFRARFTNFLHEALCRLHLRKRVSEETGLAPAQSNISDQ